MKIETLSKSKHYLVAIWLVLLLSSTLSSCAHPPLIDRNQPVSYYTLSVPALPPEPPTPYAQKPKTKIPLKVAQKTLIIIDPGHGGKDLGTYSKKPHKYQEKFIALSTSKMLKNYLEELGYAVLMTRNTDEFISLEDRAEFANSRDPKLFVSIHYNSAPNKQAEGIEIFYYTSLEDKKRSKASKLLGQKVLKHVLELTKAKSRGVKEGNLHVIRNTTMPAILVEGGFLTNEEEMTKIKEGEYQKKLAWGIALGIQEYLK